MGKRIGVDMASCRALQPVIAHRRRCTSAFLHVTLFKNTALSVCMVCPHSGITIGLQLSEYGQRVSVGATRSRLKLPHPVRYTGEVLHVMADFVGDNIGPSKVSGRAEVLQLT